MTMARLLKGFCLGLIGVVLVTVFFSASALAASPWWQLSSASRPSSLSPGGKGKLVVTATNLGNAVTSGEVKVMDKLPPGLKAFSIEAERTGGTVPVALTCVLASLTCTYTGPIAPFESVEVQIGVAVSATPQAGEANEATVTGGGGLSASTKRDLIFGEPAFGIEEYRLAAENEGGTSATQAGSHPYQVTTAVTLNQREAKTPAGKLSVPVELPKDLSFQWPAGMIGNPTVIPHCTMGQFGELVESGGENVNRCPQQTAVGVAVVVVDETLKVGRLAFTVPLFNLEPAVGEPARFGFYVPVGAVPVIIDTAVRTGGDYGITVSVHNIAQTISFLSSTVTVWGVPGDPSHDASRGWGCLQQTAGASNVELPCTPSEGGDPPPFLSLPTSCTGALQTSVEADSWLEPQSKVVTQGDAMPALDGCNRLPFAPSVRVTPDGTAASTPTGLNVDVHVPQDSVLLGKGLAESNVRGISVTLPEGVGLNPAGADGLLACSEGEIGFTGVDPASGQDLFSPGLSEPFCPDAAKVGTVRIKTPLLPNVLEGAVYLASQSANPFGSLVAMYIVAQDPVSGTLVKLPGEVSLSPSGQITGTFEHNPQLAFEDAELHFFGGERAPLATPAHCGTYTTNASFVPWSAEGGSEAVLTVQSSSAFGISSGPNGIPCPGAALSFNPSLTGGTTSIQAGGFSPFTTTMTREDGQQNLKAITLHMPPGISGLLSSVKLCGEAQANAGTCGPESEIGETIVSVGLGGDPFSVKGGKVFVTEGYEGAPYGLSIVNPAKAGPFDLGQVVVRAKIEVDPITAQLTVTTDSSGPYAIPTILDGIPLQIKHVNVTINRPGFTFNPTNCNPMQITASLSSAEGATRNVAVPLQVTNCAVLGFKPAFSVSTNGKTSRQTGASLRVKLAYPKAAFGSQANIKSVKVDLPKQLPSQLKTLQKACPAATFNANPAGCAPESRIGEARATTPLLPVPLTGPVYFVSYGGAKFPELVIVLSGYGTTVQLHAETFINKAGVTSSTFRTIPDVPVGTFELTLPQGKFPALAAPGGKLCQTKLKMPTVFTAQNGAVIKQNTPIAVTGCPKHVRHARKKTANGNLGKAGHSRASRK